MTYNGYIRNGTVVLDAPVHLPEGTIVKIELVRVKEESDAAAIPTLASRLASVIGKAEGLPVDWSENHDMYLRNASQK
jgi:hypothetical protein